MEHRLKTWVYFYGQVVSGHKKFEFRKNDRDYNVGDILVLEEWDHIRKEYTGRSVKCKVTYILLVINDFKHLGDHCIMSIDVII